MKKLFFFFLLSACFLMANAQNYWNLTGNAGTNSSNFIGTTDNQPLIFKTEGIERMRLSATKPTLGIGTITPKATLHLHYGDIEFNPLRQKTLMYITTDETGNDVGNSGFRIFSPGYGSDIHFKQQEDANFFIEGLGGGFVITPDGNVGMGIIPQVQGKYKLEINGAFRTEYAKLETFDAMNGYVSDLSAKSANIAGTLSTYDLSALQANIANTLTANKLEAQSASIANTLTANKLESQNATITNNLGIRCSNPLTHMQIGDNWTFFDGGDGFKIIGRNVIWNGTNNVRIKDGVASRIYFGGDGDIVLQTAPYGAANTSIDGYSNSMSMKNNGNVGIGTVNPGTKLEVVGTIRAHEVKVCLNQGCDYVFEDDYNLMKLSDLNNFIKTNKHLPDVAPAAEMEAEGINLSEMNALLLRKVEELTLYILQMEQRVSELENKKGGE